MLRLKKNIGSRKIGNELTVNTTDKKMTSLNGEIENSTVASRRRNGQKIIWF